METTEEKLIESTSELVIDGKEEKGREPRVIDQIGERSEIRRITKFQTA
jgi:hypothetical protein